MPVSEPEVIYTAAGRPHDTVLLAVIPAGQAFEMQCLVRLPGDKLLRPTTIRHDTTSAIRISHDIRFQIRFLTRASKERVARLSQPISFIIVRALRFLSTMHDATDTLSQCCIGESLLLRATAKGTIRRHARRRGVLKSTALCVNASASEAQLIS